MASAGKPGSTQLFQNGTYDINEFHDTFIEIGDPTEYKAALQLVGSWKEWCRLKDQSAWFKRQVRFWLEELQVCENSKQIDKIKTLAEGGSFQAAKWLAEVKYKDTDQRGRPSKAALQREARDIAKEATDTTAEAKRMEEAVINLDDRR